MTAPTGATDRPAGDKRAQIDELRRRIARITGITLEVTATGRGARPRTGYLQVAGHRGAMTWTARPAQANALRQAQ